MALGNWERLDLVIKWTGLSINAFALNIGLKRSENLYQIKKGNHGISKDLAETITRAYPEISKSWLLTEEGEMFLRRNDSVFETEAIPCLQTDVSMLYDMDDNHYKKNTNKIYIPMFEGCNFVAPATGDAMSPEIPNGAYVVFKETTLENIIPGNCYLIITSGFSSIRYVRTVPDDNLLLRLVPKNHSAYDEITIRKSDIKRLYLVQGVIINKVL